MTTRELIDIYLYRKGLKRVGGHDKDISPILPLLIMDCAYMVWREYIAKVDMKHKLRQCATMWKANYHTFNMDYFSCYNDEQKDYIIDLMDKFEAHIKNDLDIAFIQFTNVVKDEPLDRQKVLAACMIVDVLTQSAQVVWKTVYHNKVLYSVNNKYIDGCLKQNAKWRDFYYGKDKEIVDCNKDKNVVNAVNVLCRKIINFLRFIIEEENA